MRAGVNKAFKIGSSRVAGGSKHWQRTKLVEAFGWNI